MKRSLPLLLSLLLLLSVAACGTNTPASMPEVIEDPNAYLSDLFHGIYKLEEREGAYGEAKIGGGAFIPLRFSHERIEAYESYNMTAKIAAPYYECTTGVRMDFYTDADTVSFHYTVTDGFFDSNSEYATDTFNIFENGEYKSSQKVVKGVAGDVFYSRKSTEEESRITIVFPSYHGVSLSRFDLGNTRPVEDYDHKILVFGDSISQGLFADKPADGYVHQVCTNLNADYMNLSVGGEIFRTAALDEEVNFDPTYIIVALGTNDYYGGVTVDDVQTNAVSYLIKVKKIYPDIPITVIAPFGNFSADYNAAIIGAAQATECHYIDGTTLISHSPSSWNKDRVHPATPGFAEIAAALTPILQEKLG
jgi:lysophospholipase L1-like esterase